MKLFRKRNVNTSKIMEGESTINLFQEKEVFISSMDVCENISSEVIKFIEEAFDYIPTGENKKVEYQTSPTHGDDPHITIYVRLNERAEKKQSINKYEKISEVKYYVSKDYRMLQNLNPDEVNKKIINSINTYFAANGMVVKQLYVTTFIIGE